MMFYCWKGDILLWMKTLNEKIKLFASIQQMWNMFNCTRKIINNKITENKPNNHGTFYWLVFVQIILQNFLTEKKKTSFKMFC